MTPAGLIDGVLRTWFICPVFILLGIAAEFVRGNDTAGRSRIRAFLAALSVVMVLTILAWGLFLLVRGLAGEEAHFLGLVVVGIYMTPTLVLAVVHIVFHYRRMPRNFNRGAPKYTA